MLDKVQIDDLIEWLLLITFFYKKHDIEDYYRHYANNHK